MTAPHRTDPEPLRTGVHVSSEEQRIHALVEPRGELSLVNLPKLRSELEQLVDDGITDITVDLHHVSFLNSHALDLFDHIHQQLHRHHGGSLSVRLDGAPPTVQRTVQIVDDNDPTFAPQTTEVPPTRASDRPTRAAQ